MYLSILNVGMSGYTGQLNNLDYTVCIDQEYGFCGAEFYQELEPGSFSLTNKTDLEENFQDINVEGARNGDSCNADYLLIPGGHCKVSTLCRFDLNSSILMFRTTQPTTARTDSAAITWESAASDSPSSRTPRLVAGVFLRPEVDTECNFPAFQPARGDGQGRDLGQHRLHEPRLPPEVSPDVLQQPVRLSPD